MCNFFIDIPFLSSFTDFKSSVLKADTKSQEHAEILKNSLIVDRVLYPERANRELFVEGSTLKVFGYPIFPFHFLSFFLSRVFTAIDAKQLRTAVSGFLDLLQVAYRALALDEQFPK